MTGGEQREFSMQLKFAPAVGEELRMTFYSTDTTIFQILSGDVMVFTRSNWNVPQKQLIKAINTIRADSPAMLMVDATSTEGTNQDVFLPSLRFVVSNVLVRQLLRLENIFEFAVIGGTPAQVQLVMERVLEEELTFTLQVSDFQVVTSTVVAPLGTNVGTFSWAGKDSVDLSLTAAPVGSDAFRGEVQVDVWVKSASPTSAFFSGTLLTDMLRPKVTVLDASQAILASAFWYVYCPAVAFMIRCEVSLMWDYVLHSAVLSSSF